MGVRCTVKSSIAGGAHHFFVAQRSVVVPQRNGVQRNGLEGDCDPSQ
jgi:hypothetical protein